jgi:peptidyl-prolyl cis-trans isomerase D
MLQGIRSASKTIVAKAILGMLVVAFALWGVSDIFRGSVATSVAQVGDTEIPATEFTQQVQERMRAMSQQTGASFGLQDARQFGMDRIVLEEMISRAALDEVAIDLGLTATLDMVRTSIQEQPGFQGPNGAFNSLQFQRAIQFMGFTEQTYAEAVRKDLARSQLLASVGGSVLPPGGLTEILYDFFNESRVVNYFVLTPDDVGDLPAPTDDEISAFHTAHPEMFSAPDYRSIEYVTIGIDQIRDRIEVSEDDLRAEYDNPNVPFNVPEERDIQQITFNDEQSARDAKTRIDEGTGFLTIATERGLNEQDIARGNLTAEDLGGDMAQAAFALPEGGVTDPIQGQFGWVLLHVASITPGTQLTFDEAREQILEDIVATRGANMLADVANEFEDARAGGATLAEAAMEVGIEVQTIEAVDADGNLPDGTMAPIPTDPAFLEQIFATDVGEESFLFRGEDEFVEYAVRVNGVTPSALRPLETVRAEVEAAYEADTRAMQLRIMATEIAAQAQGETLAAAAEGAGKVITVTMPLGRDSVDEVVGPQLLQQFFSVPQGSVIFGLTANGQDYAVARIEDISHPIPDITSDEYAQLRDSISGQMSSDIMEAFADAARNEVGVTTYPNVIDTALGQGTFY